MSLWTYEREQWDREIQTVCGVDEAGAGPLAGPVYAAAVILPRELEIPGLNDSKKLTEKKRETLFDVIVEQAEAFCIARVEAAEIDEIDILNARMLAMQRAIDGLSVKPDLALIDGNRDHGSRYAIETPHITIIKGDGNSASIAAASILAKVARDRYVSEELDAEALRVVSASPKWKPGRMNGNKVRTSLTIPVEFRLEKKGGKSSFGIKKY